MEDTNDYFTWVFNLDYEDFITDVIKYMSKVETVQKLL